MNQETVSWISPALASTDLILYEGPIEVLRPSTGESATVDGQVQFRHRRGPHVTCRIAGDQLGPAWLLPVGGEDDLMWNIADVPRALQDPEPDEGRSWLGVPGGAKWVRSLLGSTRDQSIGEPNGVTQLQCAVVNFQDVWRLRSAPLEFEIGGWRVVLTQLHTDVNWERDCFADRDFSFTHVLSVALASEEEFSACADEVSEILHAVSIVLSFCAGRMVGLALPSGYRSGQRRWMSYETRITHAFEKVGSWFDPGLGDEIPRLVAGYLELDPAVMKVVDRAVRMTMVANHGPELDVRIPTAQSALEMLAWLILVEMFGWQTTDASKKADASANLRLLCQWAGITTEVHAAHGALEAHRKAHNLLGAPEALVKVRNDLIHPPKKITDAWPDSDLLVDAWQTGCEMLELVLLRLLGYCGSYVHRHHEGQHWVGDATPVPWRTPEPD